jgi:TPR repeat protein/predicted flap endonuclease-1-like 5' DNA nuclease
MPDIFISYKKEEREVANLLATRLTEAGYEVWWDDALLAGERFEDEITAVLDVSSLVVVLWSKQSVTSDWVKAEAETARQQKKALPVIIDDMPASKMPLLYRGMHAARLAGWEGEPDHSGYGELMGSIRERLGRGKGPKLSEEQAEAKLEESVDKAKAMVASAASSAPPPPQPSEPVAKPKPAPLPPKPTSPLRWILAGLAAIAVLGGGGAYTYLQMTTVSADDEAKIKRCVDWALSPKIEWNTTLAPLEPSTADDCALAVERYPENGSYTGMLAMVRLAQGGDKTDEAIALANRAIERKGATGHYALGIMYERGINFAVDRAKSATYFKAAAELEMPRALGRLCLMAIDGWMNLPISSTREEIGSYCSRGVAANDAFALLATGYAFESGIDGRIVNPASAAEYYQRAAELGDTQAKVRLGILYHRGYGVAFDVNRAVTLYQEAADAGDPEGMRSLAVSLELGEGIPQDVNRAAQLYEQAAIRWDIPALLISGYGIGPPSVLTARQESDANSLANASSGIATGHRIRGMMFAYGNLRTRDVATAETELKTCADAGNSNCEALLGYFYQAGLNGTRDSAKAVALYESSANKGNLYGQYYMGYVSELGDGVTQSMDKAIEYYRLAAAQGHLTAINRLQQLGQPLAN